MIRLRPHVTGKSAIAPLMVVMVACLLVIMAPILLPALMTFLE